jgi:surface polysaccharide O-acyltransferase-like enzyme
MLVGLYLLTPVLRLITANADGKIMKYFVVLWFVGASVAPVAGLFTSYHLDGNVFTITSLVGYFILGTYLLTVKIRRRTLFALISLGIGSTAIGTYAIAATIGGGRMYFFQEYLSPTMIFTTIVLFLLLNTIKPPLNKENVGHSKVNKLLNLISVNTLPIFFLHVIVLETIQLGYLGFALNGNVVNSIIGVPMMTVIVLFICLAIIVPIKKIPFVAKIIG